MCLFISFFVLILVLPVFSHLIESGFFFFDLLHYAPLDLLGVAYLVIGSL